jgi:hypothetical protein
VLSLNTGASAVYDPAATAALHDATKLVFDYFDTYNGPPRSALAATGFVTGFAANGATLTDPAGDAVTPSTTSSCGCDVVTVRREHRLGLHNDDRSEQCRFVCSCDIAAASTIKEEGLSPDRMCRNSLMAAEAGQWAMMESCR